MADHETFAARWNRRKLEAKQVEQAAITQPADRALAGGGAEIEAIEPGDETPLPTLDDVTPEGDVVAFLQKRVPAELQKLALRKAWASDPVISTFIEVAENQYDWNLPDGVPGFGPMDANWNVEELLAQAIGAVPAEVKDDLVVAAVDDQNMHSVNNLRDKTTQPMETGALPAAGVATEAVQQLSAVLQSASVTDQCAVSPDMMNDGASGVPSVQTIAAATAQTQPRAAHTVAAERQRRHGAALPDR